MITLLQQILLPYRVAGLCLYFRGQGIGCKINKYLRKRKTAHRWSTAHHIVQGKVNLGALRRLEGGRDLDGNLWYRPDWDDGAPDLTSASSCEGIRKNAVSLGAPHTEYAQEGYAPDDPARLPNLSDIPISRHVYGLAIDVLVDWDRLGGPWSERVGEIVAEFGLTRPVADEFWHFEVDPQKFFAVNPFKVIFWAVKGLFARPAGTLL